MLFVLAQRTTRPSLPSVADFKVTLAENGLLQTEFWPAHYKYKSNSRELAAAASFDQNLAARTLVFSRDVAEENRLQFYVGNWRVLVLFLIGQTEM